MRHLRLHRPSAATIISLVALFFAMGGTAVAATGGNFILGKANTANSMSSLTNTKGTALKLVAPTGAAPLQVSNSVQVSRLNASELGGKSASAFLPATGTAANSNELGGQPASAFLPATGTAANSNELGGTAASGYMQGGGDTTGARLTVSVPGSTILIGSPGAELTAVCDPGGVTGSGSAFILEGTSGSATGETALWWNKDGVGSAALKNSAFFVTPGSGSTAPYAVVVQVDNVTSITTFTATESFNSGSDTCHFTAQVVTTNG